MTMPRCLDAHAERLGETLALTFLVDGEDETVELTYAELDRRARSIAGVLAAAHPVGERVLLLLQPGPDFVAAFFGALYAGLVAVPCPPARGRRGHARVAGVIRDCTPAALISDFPLSDTLGVPHAIVAGEAMGLPGARRLREQHEHLPAFLQYTSGSTGDPKGVVVSHGQLGLNEAAICAAFGHDPSSVIVGWLPLHHDMGLVGNLLQPLYLGVPGVLMAPEHFLEAPIRWLRAVDRYRATTSGGPDFAYALCLRRTRPQDRAGLDLSSWRVAFNGAEPVRAETMAGFAEAFAPHGFRSEAFFPCYGLAEATLFVSGGPVGRGARVGHAEDGRVAVDCGAPAMETRVAAVDPESGVQLADGVVGELRVQGPSVASGYWGRAEAPAFSGQVEGRGRWLCTGDLGFLRRGAVHVTGRLRDLLLVHGQNYYPQDVETAAQSVDSALRAGRAAAFTVETEGQIAIVLVQEVHPDAVTPGLPARIAAAIVRALDVAPREVVLVAPRGVPITSSGKVRRAACRAGYLAGALPVVARGQLRGPGPCPARAEGEPASVWLTRTLDHLLGGVDRDQSLAEAGLDSLGAVELAAAIQESFGVEVATATLRGGIVPAELSDLLSGPSRRPTPRPHRLSPTQHAMWTQQRLAPDSTAYVINFAAQLPEAVDVPRLMGALTSLFERHEALRSTYDLVGGQLDRRAGGELDLARPEVTDLRAAVAEEAQTPLDPVAGRVMRARIFESPGEGRALLWSIHHIAVDLWAFELLAGELAALYEGAVLPAEAELPGWPTAESASTTTLVLPTDRPGPTRYRGASLPLSLGPESVAEFRALVAAEALSAPAMLLAVYASLLARVCGQRRVPITVPLARRQDAPEVIDCRVDAATVEIVVGDESLLQLSRTIDRALAGALDAPLARRPASPAMFVAESSRTWGAARSLPFLLGGEGGGMDLDSLELSSIPIPVTSAQVELALVAALGEGLLVELRYDVDLWTAAAVTGLAEAYTASLQAAIAAPRAPLHSAPLAGPEVRLQLDRWNRTAASFDCPSTLHGMVEAQVAATPDAVAVIHGEARLTYAELDARANHLARQLRSEGAGLETVVGVVLPRDLHRIVAALGVLKAGGAFLPVEPADPPARSRAILAAAEVVIDAPPAAQGAEPLEVEVRPGNAAYVIFTSGSTGRPKGAVNTHAAIRNRIAWMQSAYALGADDRVLHKTSAAFDVSVWELFWPIVTGASLVMAPAGAERDAEALKATIRRHEITTLHFVPSMLEAFLEAVAPGELPSLRRVISSGEALPARTCDRLFARSDAELHNLYGPTEAAIDVSAWACRPGAERVPIGRPIANLRLMVLDPELQPTPPGVPGELYLAGCGLARGYLAQPGLTAERFLPDPRGPAGARMYRTGDRARFRTDGAVEFLGRVDRQVKIRGHRVEPAEIEAVLAEHAGVRQVAVVAQRGAQDRVTLAAFYVGGAEARELEAHARARLPSYAVPAEHRAIDALPRTSSGKVDRGRLPRSHGSTGPAYRPPRSPDEALLVALFAEALDRRVGIDDDFFASGGDSIRAVKLCARARQVGLSVDLEMLHQAPSPATLAHRVGDVEPFEQVAAFGLLAAPVAVPGVEDAWPLAAIQRGMLFESADDPRTYHDVFSFELEQAPDPERLRVRLAEAIQRHPVLRSAFDLQEGLQLVFERVEPPLILGSVEPEAESQRPFDLSRAPLFRVFVDAGLGRVSLSFHHAILDGWSAATLMEALLGAEPDGRPLQTGFADYVALEQATLVDSAAREGWREALSGCTRFLLGREAPIAPRLHADFDEAPLRTLARQAGVPLKTVLLAAHLRVLVALGAGRDVLTGLVGHGRLAVPDGDRVLGVFLHTLPLRLRLSDRSWLQLARAAFEAERAALRGRRLPLPEILREHAGQPLFDTVFDFTDMAPYRRLDDTVGLRSASFLERTEFTLYARFSRRPDGRLGLGIDHRSDRGAEILALYVAAIEALSEGAESSIGSVSLAPPPATPPLSETGPLLLERLTRVMASRPEAPATVCEGRTTTYRELSRRAGAIAAHLTREGVARGARVGICLRRGEDLVAAVLGVLAAGAAYVPLDPEHPAARHAHVTADAQVRLVIDAAWCGAVVPAAWAPATVTAFDTAYLIHTSASTGPAKGVIISHGALASFLGAAQARLDLEAPDLLAVTTIAFDIAVLELLLPLCAGGTVHLATEAELRDGDALARTLASGRISVMQATPLTWQMVAEASSEPADGLVALCGGEAMPPALARRIGRPLWNLYGPTEATVWATAESIGDRDVGIGHALPNTRAYVLDPWLQPVAVGALGRLYLGGNALADGYWGQPALTAERFVPDPFAPTQGARMYDTGDWARCDRTGRLTFHGRRDDQVKIRGARVEPAEVEAALETLEDVDQCVVAARRIGDEIVLVAYVEWRGEPGAASQIRERLARRLPRALVPSYIVELAALPRLPNGKVDRRRLPQPSLERPSGDTPLDGNAKRVAAVWRQVLGCGRLDGSSNFFELGGHSLHALRIATRLRAAFAVDLPVRAVFEAPTVAGLAERVAGAQRRVTQDRGAAGLTVGQQRMWLLARMAPDSPAYHIPIVARLHGALDRGRLERALRRVVMRHPALRSRFPEREGLPSLAEGEVPAQILEPLEGGVDEALRRPFDLEAGPLLRARLRTVEEGVHELLVVLHHIIADEWSIGVLLGDLSAAYDAPLPPLERLASEAAADLGWWREALLPLAPPLDLFGASPRPPTRDLVGEVHRFVLSPEPVGALESAARAYGSTTFCAALAVFQAVLARYTGQGDFAVGIPVSGRNSAPAEAHIGLFATTAAVRSVVGDAPSFAQAMRRVREGLLEVLAHPAPWASVVAALDPPRAPDRNPVFDFFFALHDLPMPALRIGPLEVEPLTGHTGTAKFDLSLTLRRRGAGFDAEIEYATALYERASIRAFAQHFVNLLSAASAEPERSVGLLPMLGAQERARVLATPPAPGAPASIEAFVEEQVRARPDAMAVISAEASLTYEALWGRAGSLARALQASGVGPEHTVAVFLPREAELIVALLGVLRAGAAYVPLHTDWPAARRALVLEDSGHTLIVTQERLRAAMPEGAHVLVMEGLADGEPAPVHSHPERLAYLTYTSGSTGRPKGVGVPHRAVVELLRWGREAFAPEALQGVLASSSVTFDVSVFEIFGALAAGGCVILAEDLLELPEHPACDRVTYINTVPSVLSAYLETELLPESILALSLAGEALPGPLVRRAYEAGVERICNLYGPTEHCVFATEAWLDPADDAPPIGRALGANGAYLLGPGGAPVPPGAVGELHLAGAGLARGYHNRAALTAQAFLPDPHAGTPGARMYRTGDLVCQRPDGELLYLGRRDQQVKVRGFRVELGEIEAQIASHPEVLQAVVLAEGEGPERRLVAWVVPSVPADLRRRLGEQLPTYLVPSRLNSIAAPPLMTSGKIDRAALALLRGADRRSARKTPPRGPVEAGVAALWCELLELEEVGVHEDFFELGGHSLQVTRLVARIHSELDILLPLSSAYGARTVAQLAALIEADSA